MKSLVAVMLVAVLAAAPALADDAYEKCMQESDGSNAAWSECGSDLLAREDHRLNEVWKRVYALTADDTRKDLLAEQRAWVTFKDRSCKFYANGEWGREGTVLHFALCRAAVIADRIRVLETYGAFFRS